jgi:Flp pilus assembly protein TadD
MDILRRDTAAFLQRTPIRELLDVPPGVIDQARRIAHQLYRAGRFAEADIVCRGLIACDHQVGWTYSLHAAVLRKLGRLEQAMAQIQRGLAHEPEHVKLRAMRDELMACLPVPSTA